MIDLIRSLREDPDVDTSPFFVSSAMSSVSVNNETPLPPAVLRVLNSPDRAELIEVAKMLDQGSKSERFIIFYTPVGDIKCRINWQSCEPDNLRGNENLFFVKMRSSDVAFTPKSGALFEIGFVGYAHKFEVVCLAPPQQLYPGVDLMCFLPHNPPMEKNGKLREGAPSIVSGAPSDMVDTAGEPVVAGEKSASVVDFDRPRDAQD
jgi:hypothetical protein